MSVRAFSEMTYYSALALRRLGKKAPADSLLRDLLAYAQSLAKTEAKIDYFATSLPTMLLFADDLQARQLTTAKFLEAQARLGLGQKKRAATLLAEVLRRAPTTPSPRPRRFRRVKAAKAFDIPIAKPATGFVSS
jgi:hypothetical protein